MSNRLEDIDNICKNCENATILSNPDEVLCSKNGIVKPNYKCSKYSLDVIKIKPRRNNAQSDFEPVDID